MCRRKLIEVAKARGKIAYSDLARHLGVANQWKGWEALLGEIYDQEIREGRPDITLVVVYKATGLGRLGTPGNHREIETPEDKDEFAKRLAEVHDCWAKRNPN